MFPFLDQVSERVRFIQEVVVGVGVEDNGKEQQDAHHLLATLLSSLHQDLLTVRHNFTMQRHSALTFTFTHLQYQHSLNIF